MAVDRLVGKYDEELTGASRSALLELAVTLRSYRNSIVLIGGWVPYFLIEKFGRSEYHHVGSIDIAFAVDPEQVDPDPYASIVELIKRRGYTERRSVEDQPIQFSFSKSVPSPIGQREFEISVDFLTSRSTNAGARRHRKVQPGLPARMAEGCELAFRHNIEMSIQGVLHSNGEATAKVKMLNIPGCLGMKGIVLGARYAEKDAYDIYSVISQCLDGVANVAAEVRKCLGDAEMARGIQVIEKKFRGIRAEGPSWVAMFMHPTDQSMRERMTAEVYAVMQKFLTALRSKAPKQ